MLISWFCVSWIHSPSSSMWKSWEKGEGKKELQVCWVPSKEARGAWCFPLGPLHLRKGDWFSISGLKTSFKQPATSGQRSRHVWRFFRSRGRRGLGKTQYLVLWSIQASALRRSPLQTLARLRERRGIQLGRNGLVTFPLLSLGPHQNQDSNKKARGQNPPTIASLDWRLSPASSLSWGRKRSLNPEREMVPPRGPGNHVRLYLGHVGKT